MIELIVTLILFSIADVPPPAVPLPMLDLQPFVVPGAEAS